MMRVLEAWLEAQGGRGVMLTLRGGEWHADAVVPDDNWPPSVMTSGGPDGVGLPNHQEALGSLNASLLVEAGALIGAHRKELEDG